MGVDGAEGLWGEGWGECEEEGGWWIFRSGGGGGRLFVVGGEEQGRRERKEGQRCLVLGAVVEARVWAHGHEG